MVINWTKSTIQNHTNQIDTCVTSCGSKECPICFVGTWDLYNHLFGYICNLVFGSHLIFMNIPPKKNTEGILWLLVGLRYLLVLRSNWHGRILPFLHFAIYKRVSPLQPLHCALLWVTILGYHPVPGPLLWVNIYLPYIMCRPLKNNQNYITNRWSNSLLQKITHHSLRLQNWICSTIQRFLFCNWCHTKSLAELIYISSSKNIIMTSIMQVSNIFQWLLFTIFANKAISNYRCTLLSSNLKLDLLWAQLVQSRMPWESHDPNQEPLSTKWPIGLVSAVLNLQDSTSNAHDIIKMLYMGLYDWTLGIGWQDSLFMGRKRWCNSIFHLLFPFRSWTLFEEMLC